MNRRHGIAAAAAWLAGCGVPGPRPEHRYHVLEAPPVPPVPPLPGAAPLRPHAATLLVAPTTVAGFYDSQAIVFARSAGTRSTYQLNSWTEAPGRRTSALLLARLEAAGAFRAVAATTAGVRGELLLRTQLDEIYHDASTPPGVARVRLTAELSDPTKRLLLGRRRFSAAVPVAPFDADGAVRAIGQALGQVLDELTAWVDQRAGD